jgi:hypothetical protein
VLIEREADGATILPVSDALDDAAFGEHLAGAPSANARV